MTDEYEALAERLMLNHLAAEWPSVLRDHAEAMLAEVRAKLEGALREANRVILDRDRTIAEQAAVIERLRAALKASYDAAAEYYRYWTGGETRGSYDGKPERKALWKAMYSASAALGGPNAK